MVKRIIPLNNPNLLCSCAGHGYNDNLRVIIWSLITKSIYSTIQESQKTGFSDIIQLKFNKKYKNHIVICRDRCWSINLWKIPEKQTEEPVNSKGVKKIGKDHRDTISCVIELQNGNLVLGSHDKTIQIWNIDDETVLYKATYKEWITSISNIKDNIIYFAYRDNIQKIEYEIKENEENVIIKNNITIREGEVKTGNNRNSILIPQHEKNKDIEFIYSNGYNIFLVKHKNNLITVKNKNAISSVNTILELPNGEILVSSMGFKIFILNDFLIEKNPTELFHSKHVIKTICRLKEFSNVVWNKSNHNYYKKEFREIIKYLIFLNGYHNNEDLDCIFYNIPSDVIFYILFPYFSNEHFDPIIIFFEPNVDEPPPPKIQKEKKQHDTIIKTKKGKCCSII